jgi:hypothetical protein
LLIHAFACEFCSLEEDISHLLPGALAVFGAGDSLINQFNDQILNLWYGDALLILPICFCRTGLLYFHHDLLVVVLEFGELQVVLLHAEVLVVLE